MKLTLEEADILWARDLLSRMENEVLLRLSYKGEMEFPLKIASIMDILCSLTEKVRVAKELVQDMSHPAILDIENIHYMAVPDGREFRPFVETIYLMSLDGDRFSSNFERAIMVIEGPVKIEVAISPFCPHCPPVVQRVNRFGVINRNIQVFIIDCLAFEGERRRLGVTSTPSLIINGNTRVVGSIGDDSLMKIMMEGVSKETIELILLSHIRNGEVEGAIEIVLLHPEVSAQILAGLVGSEGFEKRMGAMLIIEEIVRRDRRLLEGAIPVLKGLLWSPIPQVRGDASYILGKIGSRDLIEDLKRLLHDPDPDVVDCVREAIEELS